MMVIFDVELGGHDNYKIWEEGQTTAIVFEMKSQDTQEQDKFFKKALYAELEEQDIGCLTPKTSGFLTSCRASVCRVKTMWRSPITPVRNCSCG